MGPHTNMPHLPVVDNLIRNPSVVRFPTSPPNPQKHHHQSINQFLFPRISSHQFPFYLFLFHLRLGPRLDLQYRPLADNPSRLQSASRSIDFGLFPEAATTSNPTCWIIALQLTCFSKRKPQPAVSRWVVVSADKAAVFVNLPFHPRFHVASLIINNIYSIRAKFPYLESGWIFPFLFLYIYFIIIFLFK